MSEQNTQVTTVRVDYVCDKCQKAVMIVDMESDPNPPTYMCPNCDYKVMLKTLYPYFIYTEVK